MGLTGFLALLLLAVHEPPTTERAQFAARFDPTGLEFEAAPDATLRIGAVEPRRGDVRLALGAAAPGEAGAFTLFDRAPGVVERSERVEGGIDHSLVVDGPVDGEVHPVDDGLALLRVAAQHGRGDAWSVRHDTDREPQPRPVPAAQQHRRPRRHGDAGLEQRVVRAARRQREPLRHVRRHNAALAGVRADVQWLVFEPGIAPRRVVADFGATGVVRLEVD